MKRLLAAFAAFLVLAISSASYGVLPGEMLDDPALEARARAISKELRCVVCQNQTIDDSNAPLARDMRVLVRERLLEGDTDQDVKAYLVTRYGDFVLMRPPVKGKTLFLWAGPLLFIAAGFLGFGLYLRNSRRVATLAITPLTKEEEAALSDAIADDEA